MACNHRHTQKLLLHGLRWNTFALVTRLEPIDDSALVARLNQNP